MASLKQSTAYTRLFLMIDSTDHFSPKTGLTVAVTLSKAGAAFGAAAGTVTEVANGWYKIAYTTADTGTLGDLAAHCTATGADNTDFVDQVSARINDDFAYPATSGRSMVVDASGLVDANTVKIGPTGSGTAQTARDIGGAVPSVAAGASGGLLISGSNSGTTTFGAVTCTGSFTVSDGLLISRSSSNTSAITATGNGTGSGAVFTSGSGATGDGVQATAASANGNGMKLVSAGTGKDFNATSTPLTLAKTTNITGFNDIAATAIVSSGAITTSGGAVSTVTTVTNQLTAAQVATGVWQDTTAGDFTVASSIGKSLYTTGNAPGAASGLALVGSNMGTVSSVTAGVTVTTNNDKTGYSLTQAFPANFSALGISAAGKINEVVLCDTLTTYTGNTPQTGDCYARLGAPAGASVSADIAQIEAQTVAIPSAATIATSVLTTVMTESYPVRGATFTLAQGLYDVVQQLSEQSVTGTLMTVKKRDRTTTAKTLTINDATNPTGITETS